MQTVTKLFILVHSMIGNVQLSPFVDQGFTHQLLPHSLATPRVKRIRFVFKANGKLLLPHLHQIAFAKIGVFVVPTNTLVWPQRHPAIEFVSLTPHAPLTNTKS